VQNPCIPRKTRRSAGGADHSADVINLSLGELPVLSQIAPLNAEITDAIDHAWAQGSLEVAAAGNETFPLCDSPALRGPHVCVGATDSRGLPSITRTSERARFRDRAGARRAGKRLLRGRRGHLVDDVARLGLLPPRHRGLRHLAGTSMATPFVSGVAALLAGQGLTNQQIVDRLQTTSSNHGSYDPIYGWAS
jgi:subtilisin family serine protease